MTPEMGERRPGEETASEENNPHKPKPDPWLMPILGRVGAFLHFGQMGRCDHEDDIKANGGTVDLFHEEATLTVRCDKCADAYRDAFGPTYHLPCLRCGWKAQKVYHFMPWRQLEVRITLCRKCGQMCERERERAIS